MLLSVAGDGTGDTQKHRSEEHTSELQSHLNLVCRLLLEKKKRNCARIGSVRFPSLHHTASCEFLKLQSADLITQSACRLRSLSFFPSEPPTHITPFFF